MYAGLITSDETAGQVPSDVTPYTDFDSRIYVLEVTRPSPHALQSAARAGS